MIQIVGVHGVWSHRPRLSDEAAGQELGEQWSAVLRSAMPDVEVDLRLAYYAPAVNPVVAQAGADESDFMPDEVYELALAWARALDALPQDVAMGRLTVPLRWIVDMMAKRLARDEQALRRFAAVFLREVHAYFSVAGARVGAQAVVAQAMSEHRPHIVIAHSFGSVVAYETLFAYPELTIDLFLTLGSPLALGAIFERLQPPPVAGVGLRPSNVQRWVNIADPGDIVAVPRPFTRWFAPDRNVDDMPIGLVDFHSAGNYLAAKPTVDEILAYARAHQAPG